MNRQGLPRTLPGLAKVALQVRLNVLTVNAKRAVKLLAQRAAPLGSRPKSASA